MTFTGAGNMFAPEGASIAWQAHLGGFLMGLLIFGLIDPVRGGVKTDHPEGV